MAEALRSSKPLPDGSKCSQIPELLLRQCSIVIQKVGLRSLSEIHIKTKEEGRKESPGKRAKKRNEWLKEEGLDRYWENLHCSHKAGAEQMHPAGRAAIWCRQLTPQLGFWLYRSPGDRKANPVQRCVCFPSGSLLSLLKHCLVWGPLRGHIFSMCHTAMGTCAQRCNQAAEARSGGGGGLQNPWLGSQ